MNAELAIATTELERAITVVVEAKDKEAVLIALRKVTYAMAAADAARNRREELAREFFFFFFFFIHVSPYAAGGYDRGPR